MTPREIAGRIQFVQRDIKREDKKLLAIYANAARGDPKELNKTLKKKDDD